MSDLPSPTLRQVTISQPNWVVRAAMVAFIIVIAVPILLLVGIALIAATLVFGVLALINSIIRRIRGDGVRNDGRENVRVIRRN